MQTGSVRAPLAPRSQSQVWLPQAETIAEAMEACLELDARDSRAGVSALQLACQMTSTLESIKDDDEHGAGMKSTSAVESHDLQAGVSMTRFVLIHSTVHLCGCVPVEL